MDELMKAMLAHLNRIEVKGRDNIVHLGACISIAEQLQNAFADAKAMEKPTE